jgi:hypothetical protein
MNYEDTTMEEEMITYHDYMGRKIVTERPSRTDLAIRAGKLATRLTKLARSFETMHFHGDSIVLRDDARHIELELADLVEILDACIRPNDYDY